MHPNPDLDVLFWGWNISSIYRSISWLDGSPVLLTPPVIFFNDSGTSLSGAGFDLTSEVEAGFGVSISKPFRTMLPLGVDCLGRSAS